MPHVALDGLRVIDLSQGIAGPYCTRLLADLGAAVIKVEPPQGDYTRNLGPFPDDLPDPDKSGLFIHLNGNKKSVTLDIDTESGRVLLRRLLEKADVLVESEAPGRLGGLGLGYEELAAARPGLVYCSITPFGQSGPYRDYRGSSLACMALSGLMYITGDPDREPLCTGSEPAEYFAALNAWVGVLAALERRAHSGAGERIDVSILESLGCADEYNSAMYSFLGAVRKRFYSRHHLPAYPSEVYPCKDGHIVAIGGTGGFPLGVAILLERPELEQNPLFINLWARFIQWRQFEELLRPYLLEHDWRDLLTRAQELRMPFAAVLDAKGLLENEHLKERGFFQPVEQPGIGSLPVAAAPFKMSETPLRCGPAPQLSEHTHDILLELGYSAEESVILRERGVT